MISKEWKIFISRRKSSYCRSTINDNDETFLQINDLPPSESILRFSVGSEHCAFLCSDGSVYGLGNNSGHQICELQRGEFSVPTKMKWLPPIFDLCCGSSFTLYLLEHNNRVIISNRSRNPYKKLDIMEPAVGIFSSIDPWIVGESGAFYFYDYDYTRSMKKFGPLHGGAPRQIISSECSVIVVTSSGDALGMSMKNIRDDGCFSHDCKVVCENEDTFVPIESLRGIKIKKVAGYYSHFLALSEDNQVFAFGNNEYGQLGVGDTIDRYNGFVRVTCCEDEKIVDIAAGRHYSILVDSSGYIWELGRTKEEMLEKKEVLMSKLEGAVAVHCGEYFTIIETGQTPINNDSYRVTPIINHEKLALDQDLNPLNNQIPQIDRKMKTEIYNLGKMNSINEERIKNW
ncbi:hypothetical protein TRFO_31815 [Tritrichomonas foetus]|uniref:Uncharacterized protein n=1 Tax=Tritrichomonas foetus TaxID=1144522 RepID=A0A1J4JV64_9EUKA|nr:hypothetical protein TRFO_31815 [Tritrichomonas foetus]|eukprot:OHT01422.1 hypothetical protein TRFO_31815 [Tritrichomonas foetus]